MAPPRTTIASALPGAPASGSSCSTSSCPAAWTASAKTPGPTLGPCVIASTRTARAGLLLLPRGDDEADGAAPYDHRGPRRADAGHTERRRARRRPGRERRPGLEEDDLRLRRL